MHSWTTSIGCVLSLMSPFLSWWCRIFYEKNGIRDPATATLVSSASFNDLTKGKKITAVVIVMLLSVDNYFLSSFLSWVRKNMFLKDSFKRREIIFIKITIFGTGWQVQMVLSPHPSSSFGSECASHCSSYCSQLSCHNNSLQSRFFFLLTALQSSRRTVSPPFFFSSHKK